MNNHDANWISKHRENFENKESIYIFYQRLFGLLKNEIGEKGEALKIIEIGAGAGLSSNFMTDLRYIRTDALETGYQDEIVDAQSLPYKNKSVDVFFGVDVLHHIPNPFLFLEEVSRTLRSNGKLVLVEPAITPFSWPIYKFLHPEPMKWCVAVSKNFEYSSSEVMDANNAVPSLIFKNNSCGDLLNFDIKLKYETKLFGFLSMLATGGINSSWSIPFLRHKISDLFDWELKRSRRFGNLFFLRTVIVVTKID